MGISPWLVLLSIVIYGLLHSVLASQTVKNSARRWFGSAVDRYYRLFFVGMATVTTIPLLALPIILPDRKLYSIPMPWILFTGAIQLASAGALLYGVSQTGAGYFLGLRQALNPTVPPPHMVTDGLYHWVRHPLYTASILFIWLSPTLTVNLAVLYFGITAYMIIGSRFEENKLETEFGDAYREYRAKTPAILPRLLKKS